MIDTTLYFDKGIDLCNLLEKLKSLPESIRPVYFSEDEGKIIKENRFSNKEKFQGFVKNNPRGFFLYTENATCIIDVSVPTTGYIRVSINFDENVTEKLAAIIFQCLTNDKLIFGYACDYCEYKHRNRYYLTLGNNHIESWIGRRLEKYISGVYWCTLLSQNLIAQHNVKLAELIPESISYETLGNGAFHLLTFFKNPEEWSDNAKRLDSLCERVDGLFSRRDVEKAMVGVTKLFEYDEVIAEWR